MPTYSITAPNGRTYRMTGPAGLEQSDLIEHVLEFDPAAADPPPKPPAPSIMGAFGSGAENMYTSGRAALKGMFGDTTAAAQEGLEAQQAQEAKYGPQVGLKQVGEAWDKSGLFGALGEIGRQAPRAIAQSLPEMGGMIGGARLGAMAGSAIAPGIGTLIGGVGGGILGGVLPQTGRNLVRQQETTPGDLSMGAAAAAGTAQAALETVTPVAMAGTRILSKVLGRDMSAVLARVGPEAAEEIAARSLRATLARGAAIGTVGEGTTEVAQQALERLQAGKPLLDNEAMSEYGEAAYGGALAGLPLGAAAHGYHRVGAQKDVAATQEAAAQQESQRAAEAAAAEQQRAAEADAQRKADPDYAMQVGEQYAAYEAKIKELVARKAAFRAEKTQAGNEAAKAVDEELRAHLAGGKDIIAEFNATRAARAAMQAPTGAPAAPAGALFGGYEGAKTQQRVDELQAQIDERTQDLSTANEQVLAIMRDGTSAQIAQARTGLAQRERELQAARDEFDKLAPGVREKQESEAAAADADAIERMNFDPDVAQQRIAELTERLQQVNDPSEAKKAEGWARERERLQTLLAEHAADTAPGAIEREQTPDEDLYQLQHRLRREDKQAGLRRVAQERGQEALGRGEATQAWPDLDPRSHEPPGTAYGDTAENLARETSEAADRVFAPTARSGIVDTAAQGTEAGAAVQTTEGEAIAQRLTRMSDEDRAENAKLLQAHGAKVKAALYAGLKQARAERKPGGSTVRVESFVEAIRKIAAMEKETKGRAHYEPEFYDITAPLVPDAVQGARRILGISTPKAGAGTSGRGTALHRATQAREGARLEGVEFPELTAAMQAELEGPATPTKPETGKRHQGVAPRREAPAEVEPGQASLFEPVAPTAPVDARTALRQRIDRLLALPRLRAQARATLQRAADLLGGVRNQAQTEAFAADLRAKLLARNETLPKKERLTPEEIDRQTRVAPTAVPARVLENITEMVERAERGVGFSVTPTQQVPLKRAATAREVQGTGTLVGDEGELFPSTSTATVVQGPTGDAGKAQRKAQVSQAGYLGTAARKAIIAAEQAVAKAKAEPDNKAQAEKAEAAAAQAREAIARARAAEKPAQPPEQQGKRPVALQRLETEKIGDAGRDESQQGDMFDTLYAGRATPKGFQRALDTSALPSKRGAKAIGKKVQGLLMARGLLQLKLKGLKARLLDANKARQRLQGISPQLEEMPQAARKKAADELHANMMTATLAAHRANDQLQEARKPRAEGETVEEFDERTLLAERAEQALELQTARVEFLKTLRKALTEADAAPALEAATVHHEAIVARLAATEAQIVKNDADLKLRHKEQAKEQRKTAKVAVTGPNVERTQPRKLQQQQPPVKAHVPTEAEKVRTATTRSGTEYTELTGQEATAHEAKEKPDTALQIEGTLADAATEALAVPGVTQTALDEITARVGAYDTARAFTTRAGVVENELSAVEAEMQRMQRASTQNVGALNREQLEDQYKAAKTSVERARIQGQMDLAEVVHSVADTKRVPLTESKRYGALKTQQALLEFERDAIDARQQQVRIDENAPAKAKVKVAQPRAKPGTVEPATKLITDEINELTGVDEPITRMAAKAMTRAKKTRYQARSTTGGVDLEVAGAAATARGVAERDRRAAAAKEAQETQAAAAAMEAEGGRTVPKVVSDAYASLEQVALSDQNMEHAHDGQLDKILESLARTGSTPQVREIAAKLSALLGDTKLRVRADVRENVAADYNAETNTITIHPLALTEENLVHEGVHGATLAALIAPESALTQSQRNARNELKRLLERIQKDPAFAREYGRENLAELASEVMSNKDLRAKIDKQYPPGFLRRMWNAVLQMLGVTPRTASERAMASIEKLFKPAHQFTAAEGAAMRDMLGATSVASVARAAPVSALDQFSAMITAEPKQTGIRAVLRDSNLGLVAEQNLVDQRAGILKALSRGDQTAYMQAQYNLRKADARMAQVYAVLQRGPAQLKRDTKGNHIVEAGNGPSAVDIFKTIAALPGATPEAKFAVAQAYMVAQRAANKGWDKLGFETSDQFRTAGEAALAQANADPALKAKLDAVRNMYNDYNKGMVQFLTDTGAIPKALAHKLTKDGDYVPFYRVDAANGVAELVMGEGANIRVGDVRKQPYLHQLKGDSSKLMPLNEAIMRNTMLLTNMGLTNMATKSVAYALQDMSPKGTNTIKAGKAPAGADIVKFNQEPDANRADDTGERWMRVQSEGTPFEGIPAEMLVQSLEGTHHVMTGMGKLASYFGDVLRAGVTRSPVYVIRQLIRDPMSAAFTAGTSRGPVRAMLETLREFTAQSMGNTQTGETLMRKGVTQSGIFTGDADDLAKFARQLVQGNEGAITRLISMADRAAMRADAATRVQVYNDALKATGSEMQAELAAMEMMNFSKRGSNPTVQHAARMIPFLNAQMQGLNVLAKAMRGNATMEEKMQIRSKFLKSAGMLSAISLIYALGMEDNDEYKNATAQERFNNFFVPTPAGTLKLPIPYEVGLLFKALPEAAARAMSKGLDETDWKALRNATLNAIPGVSSYGVPQAAKPLIELGLNRSMFTGRDIETSEQQKLDPEQRYGETTTELAKAISSMLPSGLGISPLKIEHAVRGYMGGIPIAAASLANEVLSDASMPERRGSQTPLFGGLVADPLGRGALDRAYAKAAAIDQAGNTYDKLIKDGKYAAALKYREDNLNVLQAEQLNTRFEADMKNFKAARAAVMQVTQMPADEKRKRIDMIEQARNQRADIFTQAVKSVATAH